MGIIARIYDFVAGTKIRSAEVDAEFNQLVSAHNDHDTKIGTIQSDRQLLSEKGMANGYAPLNSSAKIDSIYILDSILGQLEYQGTYNATTNTPALPSASTVKGHYYVVSVGGTIGSIVYVVGDWIVSNGTAWEKVDNTDSVSTVFGRTGAIVPATNDYNFAQIDKTNSSLLDLTTRSASDLNIGFLPTARIQDATLTADKFVPGVLTNETANGLQIVALQAETVKKGELCFNAKDYNVSGSNQYTSGSMSSGSNQITVDSTIDFEVGQGVLIAGAGTALPEVLSLVVQNEPTTSGTVSLTLPGETAKTVSVSAVKETATIQVTAGASATGTIYLVVDGTDFEVPVTSGETAIQIADRIRGWFIEGWTPYNGITGTWTNGGTAGTDTVILTAADPQQRKDTKFFSGETGVTATVTLSKGSLSRRQDIGDAIRGLTFTNWTVATGYNNSNVVFFISKTNGAKGGETSVYSDGGTGATGGCEAVQYGSYLVASITNISANTLTLDINTVNTVSNVYVGHDDTEAIVNALSSAAGEKLFIPEGTYLISQTLFPSAYTIISGAGNQSTILQYQAVGVNGIQLDVNKDYVHIEHLKLKNVCAPDTYFVGVPNGGVGSEFKAIWINAANHTTVQYCVIDNSDDSGIADNYSSYTRLLYNTILNISEGSGIELLKQDRATIIGNQIRYCSQHGIRVCGSIKTTIAYNVVEYNDDGVSIQGMGNGSNVIIQRSEGFLISQNHILHNTIGGVVLFNQVNNGRIENNYINNKYYANSTIGIEFRYVAYGNRINRVFDIMVKNNTVKGYNKAVSVNGDARKIFIKNNELYLWEDVTANSAYGVYLNTSGLGNLAGIHIDGNTVIANCDNKYGVRLFTGSAGTVVYVHNNTFILRINGVTLSTNAVFNVVSGTFPNNLVSTKSTSTAGTTLDTNVYVAMER